MACLPVIKFPSTATPEEIGKGLRDVLDAYQAGLPHSSDEKAEFLKAAGYRSWNAIEAGARSCWINETETSLIFTPLRYGGTRGPNAGFQPFGPKPTTVSANVSDEALGNALLQILSQCE